VADGVRSKFPLPSHGWCLTNSERTLKNFVHDVYHEYLEFALSRNYLNFSFLQLFAFVLLCDDHRLRDDVAFEYVMIDEFSGLQRDPVQTRTPARGHKQRLCRR